jgi:UDP-glucose 4-epimerase
MIAGYSSPICFPGRGHAESGPGRLLAVVGLTAMPDGSVLVTGAHGFLGRHVARAFASRGLLVRGLGHGSWPAEEWRRWGLAEWHATDVTLEALLTYAGEPETIVHCAGSASVGFSMLRPYQDFQRTVGTTMSVLEFIRTRTVGARLVYPSSGSVYGSVAGPAAEDQPSRPYSPYAVHKLIGEQLCAEYGRVFGVASSVVRFFSIYGPGLRKQLLWDACNRLSRGGAVFSGTGRERRDFLHVEDAVALIALAVERASPDAPVVNGGTGIAPSVAEVIDEVTTALPRNERPAFSGAGRPGDPETMVAEASRARTWGWAPRTGWREGVREYCAWFLSGVP